MTFCGQRWLKSQGCFTYSWWFATIVLKNQFSTEIVPRNSHMLRSLQASIVQKWRMSTPSAKLFIHSVSFKLCCLHVVCALFVLWASASSTFMSFLGSNPVFIELTPKCVPFCVRIKHENDANHTTKAKWKRNKQEKNQQKNQNKERNKRTFGATTSRSSWNWKARCY